MHGAKAGEDVQGRLRNVVVVGVTGDRHAVDGVAPDGREVRWVGHNPLALMAMFFMFVLGLVFIILTGLGLYAQGYGWGSGWMNAFGWVTTLFGTPQAVRTVHHLAMWYLVLFAMVYVYMVFREDIMSGETIISTMVNGIRMFKREPGA